MNFLDIKKVDAYLEKLVGGKGPAVQRWVKTVVKRHLAKQEGLRSKADANGELARLGIKVIPVMREVDAILMSTKYTGTLVMPQSLSPYQIRKLAPWARKYLRDGGVLYTIDEEMSEQFANNVRHWADALLAVYPNRKTYDNISIEAVHLLADEWVRRLNRESIESNKGETVVVWTGIVKIDVKTHTYTIERLENKAAYEWEGSRMDNCVASYWPRNSDIYSVRVDGVIPLMTVEVRDNKVMQMEGPANTVPPDHLKKLFHPFAAQAGIAIPLTGGERGQFNLYFSSLTKTEVVGLSNTGEFDIILHGTMTKEQHELFQRETATHVVSNVGQRLTTNLLAHT